jgi:hypothetical protein
MRARAWLSCLVAAAWVCGLVYAWGEVGAGALVTFALLGFFAAFLLSRGRRRA